MAEPDPIDSFLDDMEGGQRAATSRSDSNTVRDLETRNSINLDWRNITVRVGPVTAKKTILSNVSGQLTSGELVAIMGPSGSGKTSLLNMLNGRYQETSWTGEFYVNGNEFDSTQWGDRAAFVQQGNYLLGHQTVREVLIFAAKMRLFGTEEEIMEVVDRTINELGLTECANVICGDEETKGISGGQAKRVCIGRDLVTNPNLIMLDEPTSGLDSFTAVKVVELLRRMANNGRSVLATIHQPSQTLSRLFDRFIIMDAGEVFVEGSMEEMKQKCASKGHPCPADIPITEWVFQLIEELPEADHQVWKEDARMESGGEPIQQQGDNLGMFKKVQTPCSFLYELSLHINREWEMLTRNPFM